MDDTETKLNLGCGPNSAAGWLNYDWGVLPLLSKMPWLRKTAITLRLLPAYYEAPWPKIQLVDIRKRLPLRDGSMEFIYCSHVLEHFDRWEAVRVLKECHRCLRDGGIMRIVVPDIVKMFALYQEAARQPASAGGEPRPARDLCRLWWGFSTDEDPGGFFGKLSRWFMRHHRWHYDRRELELLAKEAGFGRMVVCDFRQGSVSDLETLDYEAHKPHSIYVEVSK
ncbi:MAG: methyltransferase domain-containing protein [Verrucomicrobia bacterium]|nr:methyltransferase domain-containing protein [Verrucomicrobiota bacterium]